MCNILLLLENEFSLSITFLLLFETVTSKLQHTFGSDYANGLSY